MESVGNVPSQVTGAGLPAAWWAVARMSFEAEERSVSGVCRVAAMAKAAVMVYEAAVENRRREEDR